MENAPANVVVENLKEHIERTDMMRPDIIL